jgi:hypothetical protein
MALWVVGAAMFAAPQATTEKKYEPTENQALRLKFLHKDLELAQLQAQVAFARFNQATAELAAEGAKVKTENKWPAELVFDNDKLTFTMPPAPPPKPEEKKK